MDKIIELAPAKINLYLKVIRKRDDGYHDIETLFERIDIFDKVSLKTAKKDIVIECDIPGIPTGIGSLCYRAVELLKNRFNVDSGISINIKKKIPVAAGLGGGSSDAAGILKGLNKLCALKLEKKELLDLARQLGADVSFFLEDTSFAIGRDRGDNIKPVKSRKKYWHLIVTPNIMLLSGEIYKLYSETHSLDLTINEPVDKILNPALIISSINRLKAIIHNDLESIVLSREPNIKNIKDKLNEVSGGSALISGSGPSIFSLFETRKEALRAKNEIFRRFPDSQGWRVFVAKTF